MRPRLTCAEPTTNRRDHSMGGKGTHGQPPTVAEVCTDEMQVFALSITRFTATGCMTRGVACWDAGCLSADDVLGPMNGPRLVAELIGVMRARQTERQQPWQSRSATCCRVTRDEIGLLSALGHPQGADRAALASATRVLIGREVAPRLTAAFEVAAETLKSIRPMLAMPASSRPATPSTLHERTA